MPSHNDQYWLADIDSQGRVYLKNYNSGKLVVVDGDNPNEGTAVIQYHDNGNSGQRWFFVN